MNMKNLQHDPVGDDVQEDECRRHEDFEAAMEIVGSWGFWQKKMFVIISCCQMFSAIHTVAAVFLSATPDHLCKMPFVQSSNTLYRINSSATENSSCEISSLQVYSNLSNNGDKFDNETIPCKEWYYDQSIYIATAVSEWDLVCANKWLGATLKATFMAGILVGSVSFGQISDKIGRRITILFCVIFTIISGIGASFVNSYLAFLTLRFMVAMPCAGMMVCNFVLLMELIKPEARTMVGMFNGIPFGLGIAVVSLFAAFLREWRDLQLAISLFTGVLLIYIWILPESPRWLVSKGRIGEALVILKQIAEGNGRTLPEDSQMLKLLSAKAPMKQEEEHQGKKGHSCSFLSDQYTLVRTPVMRRRCLVSFYLWFASAMIYYGLIFYNANIDGNVHLMTGISGLVEVPAFILVAYALFKFGRRMTSCTLFFICSLFLLILMVVPKEQSYVLYFLATAGKFFDTAVFQLCYLYTSELVPTGVRNVAVGTSSMFARIGAVCAPYIVELLGDVHYSAPSAVFGILALVAGGLSLLLPETGNKVLPQTVEEVESQKR